MNIAICDDDLRIHKKLTAIIRQEITFPYRLTSFSDGEALVMYFHENKVPLDVIFLDICMDKMDGIIAAHQIRALNPSVMIIFLTSSPKHWAQGFNVQALDYLLKPIKADKVVALLAQASEKLESQQATVLLKNERGLFRARVNDIMYLESKARWVTFYFRNGTSHKECNTLASFIEAWPSSQFYRIHESFFVNMSYAYSIERTGSLSNNKSLAMSNGQVLPISRTRFDGVFATFTKQQKGDLL